MTTIQWILLDHIVALLTAVTWIGTGVAAARGRARLALGLMLLGCGAVLARGLTVLALARAGWWFAEEKVVVVLPLTTTSALIAVLLAAPRLLRAARGAGRDLPVASVVAPLAVGYAAAIGLALTLLAGYPLTWSGALITLAALGGAVLPTLRVVDRPAEPSLATPADDAPAALGGPTRRRFVTLAGALVVAAGGTGLGLPFLPGRETSTGGGPGARGRRSVPVTELRGPSRPAPGGARIQRVLTARTATATLGPAAELDVWTYDGLVPGPAIVATAGDLVEVTLRNDDIEDGVTIHWHGYDVPCGEDGVPGSTQAAVAPGEEFAYRFRADQVGTYWYHTHEASAEAVRRGLYGTLVVQPREVPDRDDSIHGLDITLPVHTFGGVTVLGDRAGRTGHAVDAGAPVRLRLVNTDSHPHRFALAGSTFRVASVDGRDLNAPGELREVALRIPAGGRHDLVLAMPDAPAALLVDDDPGTGVDLRPTGTEAAVTHSPDTGDWPDLDLLGYGRPAALPFDPDRANRHFTMVLDRGVAFVDGRPAFAQTVNGMAHPSIPDQLVTAGDIVRYTVVNRSLETHQWHLHGHTVLVLSRNGVPSTGSPLLLDTFDVRPGEVWEVAFAATNPGVWMNHCHNLPHAEQGMMLRLVYDGVTPYDDASRHHH